MKRPSLRYLLGAFILLIPFLAILSIQAQSPSMPPSKPWSPEAAQYRFHMIGNSHIDAVWLWTWPEGMAAVVSAFRSALERIKEDPEFTFTASSAQFYEWVAANRPLADPANPRARGRGPLGLGGRMVGGARYQYAERRSVGTAGALRPERVPTPLQQYVDAWARFWQCYYWFRYVLLPVVTLHKTIERLSHPALKLTHWV